MAPNPPRETRSAWPLLALALVSGLITMALSVPSSDAPREAGDICLLYTSDAADERSSVDLGGRRSIKKIKE